MNYGLSGTKLFSFVCRLLSTKYITFASLFLVFSIKKEQLREAEPLLFPIDVLRECASKSTE